MQSVNAAKFNAATDRSSFILICADFFFLFQKWCKAILKHIYLNVRPHEFQEMYSQVSVLYVGFQIWRGRGTPVHIDSSSAWASVVLVVKTMESGCA